MLHATSADPAHETDLMDVSQSGQYEVLPACPAVPLHGIQDMYLGSMHPTKTHVANRHRLLTRYDKCSGVSSCQELAKNVLCTQTCAWMWKRTRVKGHPDEWWPGLIYCQQMIPIPATCHEKRQILKLQSACVPGKMARIPIDNSCNGGWRTSARRCRCCQCHLWRS